MPGHQTGLCPHGAWAVVWAVLQSLCLVSMGPATEEPLQDFHGHWDTGRLDRQGRGFRWSGISSWSHEKERH
jgi:hypothetical protein